MFFKGYRLTTTSYQSQHEKEHVDEVQVELERAEDTELYLGISSWLHVHLRGHAAIIAKPLPLAPVVY